MIFDKEKYKAALTEYYHTHFGEKDTDFWYERPAVNVWVFGREDKIITLKSDIRTFQVSEHVETKETSH